MAVAHEPDLLIELLNEAARTLDGQVGLLSTAQVAEILGRRRTWVHAHAATLGGFRLPASREWRFCPRGVAHGVLGLAEPEGPAQRPLEPGAHRGRSSSRRLSYPPAKNELDDRTRITRRSVRSD